MKIPNCVKIAIQLLEKSGFEAYAVGGCVRDTVLKKIPNDWDICTNALPEQVIKVFKDYHVFETGLKHGTVTVRIEHNSLEITTFRTDGEYSDHRRPENVSFVTSLEEDLSRRDFTVNALAFSERTGIIDKVNGLADIENKIIRCVGNAKKRFDEDALRILRCLRFASVLGFDIEEKTSKAVHNQKELLKLISSERIKEELLKLLCGKNVVKILTEYKDIIAVIIPEIEDTFGFRQENPHHCYDVYTHTVISVGYVKNNPILRMIMLLHDIAKPKTFKLDENGVGHFKLHPLIGSDMADVILRELKFDNISRKYICDQILEHDNRFPDNEKTVRRFISKHDYNFYFDHLEIRRADTLAQSEYLRKYKLDEIKVKNKIGEKLLAENATLKLKDLAINGKDLLDLGYPQGAILKTILKSCLEKVVDKELENQKTVLIKYVLDNYEKEN
ncbi:MAG: HD domain-containing protein [Clostridiales bacterium]|nr:HD domain-containing protein [Clostridiales bacterium]